MTIRTFTQNLALDETDTLAEIDQLLSDGYEVIGHYGLIMDGEPCGIWDLRKNEAAPVPTNTQLRAIVSIEPASTYSKSTQQEFAFWRCELESGEKVNIFDHPHPERNTFKIAIDKGWEEYFIRMMEGTTRLCHPPIPVNVSHDGEWYSLVNILAYALYAEMVHDPLQDAPDDIPWDYVPDDEGDESDDESTIPDDIPFPPLSEAGENEETVESALSSPKENQQSDNAVADESDDQDS